VSVIGLKGFQKDMRNALVARFANLRDQYSLAATTNDINPAIILRRKDAATLLQAPTGVGKTLIAVETVREFSAVENVIWFWFVPFAGLVSQAANTIRSQAPNLVLLDIDTDRFSEKLVSGSIFISTWQSVAAANIDSRKMRTNRDSGLSVDSLIIKARELGYRIGCVVDEAHHGFKKAKESSAFFSDVLKPDYALLMTATPKDQDALLFAKQTGYSLGDPKSWASVSRDKGVEAGLLKKGVKTVRFIAKSGDDKQVVDFEFLALQQCVEMHRFIKARLQELGVGLVPLMLVQVPNGDSAIEDVRKYLTKELKFPEEAVRVHTALEPDAHLSSIANDPTVEVLVFKMAVAMGFDAPRAFTLAALRGVRDQSFGVQVVGRLMRVHKLLQGRKNLPRVLDDGYVFLANSADQEGLRNAADVINDMRNNEPELGHQTVITIAADGAKAVQIVEAGDNLELVLEDTTNPSPEVLDASSYTETVVNDINTFGAGVLKGSYQAVLPGADFLGGAKLDSKAPTSAVTRALAGGTEKVRTFQRKSGVPAVLYSEVMPPPSDDLEEQIVNIIDFRKVLLDRERTQTKLTRREEELFDDATPDDSDVFGRYSSAVLAEKAKQITLQFEDLDSRLFSNLLLARFKKAMEDTGITVPSDTEELRRQLDVVLVRNPKLISDAQKRVRSALIALKEIPIPAELVIEGQYRKAAKNVYGVFQPKLNSDERPIAEALDTDSDVLWWYRNPDRPGYGVGLYGWSSGLHGFFPDFVVAVTGRSKSDGTALVEVKGVHIQDYDRSKAGAVHNYYGKTFMVGRRGDGDTFYFLRLVNGQLEADGAFEVARLKFNN
jgi:hypothetical protein